jgi:hypothetical protein
MNRPLTFSIEVFPPRDAALHPARQKGQLTTHSELP